MHLELILLNIMEDEMLLRASVNGEFVIEMGVPNLHSRNMVSITSPPSSGWFDVEISLVSIYIMLIGVESKRSDRTDHSLFFHTLLSLQSLAD
jgi:hypothetical protein